MIVPIQRADPGERGGGAGIRERPRLGDRRQRKDCHRDDRGDTERTSPPACEGVDQHDRARRQADAISECTARSDAGAHLRGDENDQHRLDRAEQDQ